MLPTSLTCCRSLHVVVIELREELLICLVVRAQLTVPQSLWALLIVTYCNLINSPRRVATITLSALQLATRETFFPKCLETRAPFLWLSVALFVHWNPSQQQQKETDLGQKVRTAVTKMLSEKKHIWYFATISTKDLNPFLGLHQFDQIMIKNPIRFQQRYLLSRLCQHASDCYQDMGLW